MATPRMFQLSKGKPIIPEPGQTTTEVVQRQVEEVIRIALQGHEGDRVITRPEESTDAEGSHLRRYMGWGVGRDLSVLDYGLERDMSAYDWQDLEITSPALFATEKSFAEVHRVLTAIYNNFWVFAPETAGLHIHYGRGKEWIPIHHLRRIAAFLYAADPILTQMHPPHRRESEKNFCPSNRHYSALAHGVSPAQAGRHLRVGNLDEGHYEKDSVPSPPESRPEPETKRPGFIPIFKRGTLEGYKFDKNYFASGEIEWAAEGGYLPERQVGKSLDIISGVRELLSALSGPVISVLMQHKTWRRCAYNFAAYDVGAYGAVHIYGAGPFLQAQPKRTIEFRQATGTVNADEVVAHARVAVRLCLVDEARVIQRQIAKQRGIEITDEGLDDIFNIAYSLKTPAKNDINPPQEIADRLSKVYYACGMLIRESALRLKLLKKNRELALALEHIDEESGLAKRCKELRLWMEAICIYCSVIDILPYAMTTNENATPHETLAIIERLHDRISLTKTEISHLDFDDDRAELRRAMIIAESALETPTIHKHFIIPRRPSSIYTRREEDVMIKAAFEDKSCFSQKRFVLFGMGGSGKTELALKYAEDFRQLFWGVFLIDGSSRKRVSGGYSDIARTVGIEPNEDSAKKWLALQNMPWLLIIDDVDPFGINLEDILPAGRNGCILLTSRSPRYNRYGTAGKKYMGVRRMAEEEAIHLVLKAAAFPTPWSINDKKSARGIAKAVDSSPLALVAAASFKFDHFSPEETP
ncbi:hypothetical protein GL218_08586 [Daldinia childiae]|uniref:uncharacterized protein n=1 Tax=Daldinia childiae TaxID=326645 RepID=UPI00144772FB|nr:uncharacterized protein GL218_08586 [Daldinia childiae]KAF3067431.1 hypothetical protein GL218_08586 [Daldinia childiae]